MPASIKFKIKYNEMPHHTSDALIICLVCQNKNYRRPSCFIMFSKNLIKSNDQFYVALILSLKRRVSYCQ